MNEVFPTCNDAAESILHTLVLCPFAECCRSATALPNFIRFQTFHDWLHMLFEHNDKNSVLTSVMLYWMLWKNRNDLVWNQRCLAVSEVLNSAVSTLNQWQYVQDTNFDHSLGLLTPEDGRVS